MPALPTEQPASGAHRPPAPSLAAGDRRSSHWPTNARAGDSKKDSISHKEGEELDMHVL